MLQASQLRRSDNSEALSKLVKAKSYLENSARLVSIYLSLVALLFQLKQMVDLWDIFKWRYCNKKNLFVVETRIAKDVLHKLKNQKSKEKKHGNTNVTLRNYEHAALVILVGLVMEATLAQTYIIYAWFSYEQMCFETFFWFLFSYSLLRVLQSWRWAKMRSRSRQRLVL